VIPPADLLPRDAEHLGPRRGEPLLGSRPRLLMALLGDVEACGERCQRLPVDLAVVGQRQTVHPVEGRRDHVSGQRRTQSVPQEVHLEWPHGGVVGHQVLGPVGPLGDDRGTLADTGYP
jgi:hypothetical protein